jgi:hypothetical protein
MRFGLFEVIFEQAMPKRFDQFIHFTPQPSSLPNNKTIRQVARITRKEKLFPNYRKTTASPPTTSSDSEESTIKPNLEIDPLTGLSVTKIGGVPLDRFSNAQPHQSSIYGDKKPDQC